jgi:tubulin polyglutamylase TTLL6/13
MCFEVLGFDVMLDAQMKPWILEVNHDPSFETESPLDFKIKRQLIGDTLKMVNLNWWRRIKYKR